MALVRQYLNRLLGSANTPPPHINAEGSPLTSSPQIWWAKSNNNIMKGCYSKIDPGDYKSEGGGYKELEV